MSINLNNKSTVNRPAQVQVPMAVVTQRVSCSPSWNWARLSIHRNRVHRGRQQGCSVHGRVVMMENCTNRLVFHLDNCNGVCCALLWSGRQRSPRWIGFLIYRVLWVLWWIHRVYMPIYLHRRNMRCHSCTRTHRQTVESSAAFYLGGRNPQLQHIP